MPVFVDIDAAVLSDTQEKLTQRKDALKIGALLTKECLAHGLQICGAVMLGEKVSGTIGRVRPILRCIYLVKAPVEFQDEIRACFAQALVSQHHQQPDICVASRETNPRKWIVRKNTFYTVPVRQTEVAVLQK